ncbi:MAG: zinc ribbon domain-containing protein [Clostridia bacterium]|nr:zinc ribbon domain-containing protein [Clostridia bacterium]MBR7111944.1 zinc ribbon domain-containing protein [Clostridia bacterium]
MKKQKYTRIILRCVGLALLLGGITLTVIGYANFGNFDNNLFGLIFLGLPCFAFGLGLTVFSFSQSIARFVKNEHAPILNELSEDINPAIKNYARAVREGMEGGDTVLCECGTPNQTTDKFCSECGKALQAACPKCGAQLATTHKFCPTCGEKLN